RGINAITTLRHFAIITYAVPPERLHLLIDSRFELDCIELAGKTRALLSVVTFEDQDFRMATFPSPRWRFGQTNYRIYVRDRFSGERVVWFLGTTLGSWMVALPRYVWRLPWHYGRFSFSCTELGTGIYDSFRVTTKSRWAPMTLELLQEAKQRPCFPGFPDEETAYVFITHPLIGYYARRDGRIGTYSVWHERLSPCAARVRVAEFGLLDRLNIVPFAEQTNPYSVLIQPRTEFLVRLPPRTC
ncbi:MAG TPA: DUF2071 domain-containing protein, partial [Candidatus Limnocylindria bacterium]|nr:DUF2071 domain-containing protein [Candidatus Limnocylindria bacterium]